MIPATEGCARLLTRLGIIRVSGEDARSFLQGQFTADLRRVSPTQALLAGWCNPQGRVLFLLQVIEDAAGFLLVLPQGELARALKRLRMFVLRARVTLEDLETRWQVLGLAASTSPAPAGEAMTLATGGCRQRGDLTACRLPGTPSRSWLLGSIEAIDAWLAEAALQPADEADWWAAETALGLPFIEGPSSERFLPQQLNLDRLGMMSFDKGCYPGQEIIARLKYRGQIKARLRSGESLHPVAPGARLYRADAAPGQSAGEVVSSIALAGKTLFTAVVDLETSGELHLDAPDGPVANLPADPGDQ